MTPAPSKKEWMVFFDFDNTITPFDVLDRVIEEFAADDRWVAFEKAWETGKIGSRECLEGQLQSVRVTQQVLSRYLSTVRVDPFFQKLLALLKQKDIGWMITSDSFDFLIEKILRSNGIPSALVYANRLAFQNDRLIPSFPFHSPDCSRCAHCKKVHVLEHQDKTTVYVGDGLSDVCPARHADLVFAKGALLDSLRKENKPCVPFRHLGSVAAFFEELGPSKRRLQKTLALIS